MNFRLNAQSLTATAALALTFAAAWPVHAQTTVATAAPTAAAGSPADDNAAVRRVLVLGKIRGHLLASITDWDMSQYDLAMHHAAEIPTELYSIVSSDLKSAGLQDSFLKAANTYAQLSMQAGDKTAVHAAYDGLIAVIQQASDAFAPTTDFSDPIFRLKVAQGLLNGVAEEYGEGVSAGKLVKPIGYQNAVGFLQIAEEQYTAARNTLPAIFAAQFPDLDKTVSAQYAMLAAAMPSSLIAPAVLPDAQVLQQSIDVIRQAEEQALSVRIVTNRSVPEIIAAARVGLNDALAAFTAGTDNAYDLSASAYLDNYEGLEVALRAKNATLTDLIESQFNQFNELIKSGGTLDDLKALDAQLSANLDQAQTILTATP